MQKSERIVRYTSDELAEMRRRGEDRTDWAKLDALTKEEIEASIDFEEEGYPDWGTARRGIPGPQQRVTMPIDTDVYEWFEAQGMGYKTKMNEVLREYVEAEKKREAVAAVQSGA
ncbi:MAG: BrnA antitoxin family protein [Thermomicrobiales bacterium]